MTPSRPAFSFDEERKPTKGSRIFGVLAGSKAAVANSQLAGTIAGPAIVEIPLYGPGAAAGLLWPSQGVPAAS